MKPSKIEYRGGDALRFATRAMELVVTTSVGPRVASFRSLAGRKKNLFLEMPVDEPRANGMLLRGGHRLWHAPEHLVRTYQADDEPLAVRPLANGVALTQPMEQRTGIVKTLAVEIDGQRTVKLTHTLTNRGLWPVECAPWALTMLRPGGYGVLPLLPKGSHAGGDLLPTYAFVPWTYTDFAMPTWDMHRDFIGVDVTKATEAQKLGITNYPGWSAYWNEGTTFVKAAPVIAGATYPDLGSAFEVFTNGNVIELETLGVLARLEPGQGVTHVEHWTVFDGLAKPNTDAAFAKLVAAVKSWMRKL